MRLPVQTGFPPGNHPMTSQKTILSIDGMTCGHCVAGVKKALAALPGVRSVDVQLTPGAATVVHDGTSVAQLTQIVADEGYTVRSVTTQ